MGAAVAHEDRFALDSVVGICLELLPVLRDFDSRLCTLKSISKESPHVFLSVDEWQGADGTRENLRSNFPQRARLHARCIRVKNDGAKEDSSSQKLFALQRSAHDHNRV